MFARKKGGFLPLPYFLSSFTKSFLIPHFPISVQKIFHFSWLDCSSLGWIRAEGQWGDRRCGSQSWNSLKRVSKHCKLHRCTRSRLYKVPKKINRDTKNFPNTVTKQHKHKCTKKDYLRNHWKRQVQCNITTPSTVTKLLHWKVHFLLYWKVHIFYCTGKFGCPTVQCCAWLLQH